MRCACGGATWGNTVNMKAAERSTQHARSAEDMERKAVSRARPRCCRAFASVLSLLFSVASLAYCVFLSVQTSEIRTRVAELENGNAELLYRPVPGFAMDTLNSLIHDRVDQLLSQRSYEHLAKIRVARQAPPDCNCPPAVIAVTSGLLVLSFRPVRQLSAHLISAPCPSRSDSTPVKRPHRMETLSHTAACHLSRYPPVHIQNLAPQAPAPAPSHMGSNEPEGGPGGQAVLRMLQRAAVPV
ncbi:hypothetical protein AAFF_G00413950 [Aldrovandia affinis]|uniref:Collagen alpha-1(XXV) chain n=1 Tax=Aldrovandia affinis TaxID=143900 RepID=A0AAD7WJM0_9TELE|nr:hypothetical protein AAFF_G00413950 [Aldrovandia affinis]